MPTVASVLGYLRLNTDGYSRKLKTAEAETRAEVLKSAAVVDKAAARMETARDKEADAAGRVRIAEAALEKLRAKANVDSAKLIVGEEKLAAALRASDAATRSVTRATNDHDRALKTMAASTEAVEKRQSRLAKVFSQLNTVAINSFDEQRINRSATAMLRFAGTATAAATAVVGIGHGVPAIAAVGAALVAASGAALVLPGALAGGAAALGVLHLGMLGVGDALKAVAEGDAKKLNEALAKLAPSARAFVLEVQRIKPEFDRMQQAIQDTLFRTLDKGLRDTAAVTLPILRTGLVGIAEEFNTLGQRVFAFFQQAGILADLELILANTKVSLHSILGVVTPLMRVFFDVAAVGSIVFADLVSGIDLAARSLAGFVHQARLSGQLETWMRNGLQVLHDIASTAFNVGQILVTVFQAANVSGIGFFGVLRGLTRELSMFLQSAQGQEILTTTFATLRAAADALLPGLRALAVALGQGIVALQPALVPLAEAFSAVAIAVAPLIPDLAHLATAILVPLANFIRDNAGAAYPLAGAILAIVAAAKIAGIILAAYQLKIALVQGASIAAAGALKLVSAAQWVLNAAMRANPIGLIITAIVGLVAGLIWAWNNVDWFRNGIMTALRAVGDAFTWLWQNAILPAAQGIATAAVWVWQNILKPVFDAISFGVRFLAAVLWVGFALPFVVAWNIISDKVREAWNVWIKPTFDAIAFAANWLWTWGIKPAADAIASGWRWMVENIQWFWKNVLEVAWLAIQLAATWLWENRLKPIFDAIGAGWRFLMDGMNWVWVNILQRAWFAIQLAAQIMWEQRLRPIFDAIGFGWRLLMDGINWVWLHILRPVFDAVSNAVSAVGDAFGWAIDKIRVIWDKLMEIAKGPVNFVIDVVYNRGIVPLWNGVAGIFALGRLNPMPLLASGGALGAGLRTDGPMAIVGEGNPQYPEYVIPTDPKFRNNAAKLWASAGADMGLPMMAGGGILGQVGDFIGNAFNAVTSWLGDITGGVRRFFAGVLGDGGRTPGGGGWTDALKAIPRKVVDAVIAKASEFFSSGGGGGYGGFAPGNVQGNVAAVQAAAAKRGWGAGPQWDALYKLVMKESGFRNTAQNPTSTAFGMFQFLNSTWAGYGIPKTAEPNAQAEAGMRYIQARYGSPLGALAFHRSHNWYERGGVIGRYANGGWLQPGDLAFNETREPEAVLNRTQLNALASGGEQHYHLTVVNAGNNEIDLRTQFRRLEWQSGLR